VRHKAIVLLKLLILVLVICLGIFTFLYFQTKKQVKTTHISEVVEVIKENIILDGYSTKNKIVPIIGVQYNPLMKGDFEKDATQIADDIQIIKAIGANTIGLYNCGKYDWYKKLNATNGIDFCNKVYLYAEKQNLKLIVGYYSNETQNWKETATIERSEKQFKELVESTKDVSSITYYLIGNEIFEKLSDEEARINYAKWIGKMLTWQQEQYPNRPLIYADNSQFTAEPYLLKYASKLQVYAINNYEWNSALQLNNIINRVNKNWPNSSVYLSEFGVDSYDSAKKVQKVSLQAQRFEYLLSELYKIYQKRSDKFIGFSIFEYDDDWSKAGKASVQEGDIASWKCLTCFDYKANEDYWGISHKETLEAIKNTLKSFN
jgi:hypothetical protein